MKGQMSRDEAMHNDWFLSRAAWCLPLQLRVADRWYQRAIGLLALPRLQRGEGLLINRCGAVHTFGMRYPIGVFFLDRNDRVIGAVGSLEPFCVSRVRHAASVVETLAIAPGELARAVACVEAAVRLQRVALNDQPGGV